jgi:dihydroflavonol-4-reductase
MREVYMAASLQFDKALIIGATGMIGTHAVHACLRRGIAVRATERPASNNQNLLGLEIEKASASLEDPEALREAMTGCDLVIHAAAPYPSRHFGKAKLLTAARAGMTSFLKTAQSQITGSLKRIVYVSSVTTIGIPAGSDGRPDRGSRAAVESDTAFPIADSAPYFELKAMLENMALAAADDGLPLTVVNPTFCVDEFDSHQTTAQLMVPLAKGQIPAYLPGLLNAVATADVGEGICLAAQRGAIGRRYILGAENMSSREFMERCALEVGVKAPALAFPLPVAEGISMVAEWLAYVTGSRPLFPMTGIRMMKNSQPFDISRARDELGYAPLPVAGAITRAYNWYRREGLI